MGSNLASRAIRWQSFGALAGAFALIIYLGVMPAFAGQNPPLPEAGEQTEEQSPPPDTPEEPAPQYRPVPPSLTLATGTLITIRTSQYLSSNQNHPGDTFSAELQQPLVVDGWVVARRGQTVLGRLAVAQKAGRIKGVSQLGVELSRLILVDGQQLPVATQLMQTSAGTSKGRDAQAVGTTTGAGAAIGAIAHGGEGAGIGALAGAGAGLVGVLLTRGRATEIPAETVLTFQLQHQVTFSTARSVPAFRPVTQADYGTGTLQRRADHFAVRPPYRRYPPPYYYGGGYYPWGYYYPGPVFFGYYGGGGRFHRHFGRR